MTVDSDAKCNTWGARAHQGKIGFSPSSPPPSAAARDSREDDLALQILTTPTDVDWTIFRKFEVIDYIITQHGEATWVERRALTALDAIKADLLRFLNPVPDGS